MKRTIKILACAAILCSAIFTGCEKNDLFSRKGEIVRFSAVSSGAPTTKTSYDQGDLVDGYQLINWGGNDTIRIWSDNALHRYGDNQHWADYYTTGYSVSGHESTATLAAKQLYNTDNDNENNTANGLVWGEEKVCQFWGIYPSKKNIPMTIGENGAVNATLPASYTLPSSSSTKTEGGGEISYKVYAPDMNYAFMTAYEKVENAPEKVNLKFNPAFTAFELYISSSEEETEGFTVNSIGLIGNDWLAGPFTMTAGDLGTVAAANGASKTVTASFSSAVKIEPSNGVNVTLFTIPKTNEDAISLQIATTDGGKATLKFTEKGSKEAYKFEAGHKYRIHLLKVGGRWMINFGGDDMDVEPWEENSTGLIVE